MRAQSAAAKHPAAGGLAGADVARTADYEGALRALGCGAAARPPLAAALALDAWLPTAGLTRLLCGDARTLRSVCDVDAVVAAAAAARLAPGAQPLDTVPAGTHPEPSDMVLDDFDPLLFGGDDDGDDLFWGEFDEADSLPAVSGVPRLPLETTPPPPAVTPAPPPLPASPPPLPLAASPPPLPLAPSLPGCDAALPLPPAPHAVSCGGSPLPKGLSPPTPTSGALPSRAAASTSTASLHRADASARGVSLSSDASMTGLAAPPVPRLRARVQARSAPARGRNFDQKVAILEAFYGRRQPLKWGCWKETADRVGDVSLSRRHVKDFMVALAVAFAEHRAGNDRPDVVQLLRCVSEQATNHFKRAWRLSKFAPVAAAADARDATTPPAADAVPNTAQSTVPNTAQSTVPDMHGVAQSAPGSP